MKKLWRKVKRATRRAVRNVAGAVAKVVATVVEDVADVVVHTAKAGWFFAIGQRGRANDHLRKARNAAGKLGVDLGWGTLGAVAIAGISAVEWWQRLLGLQEEPRPLDPIDEIPILRTIFVDALEFEDIRIVEGRLGLLDGGRWPKSIARRAPYTIGNTIYVPGRATTRSDLVHEAVHVWQYQSGGPAYIAQAVRSQNGGDVGAETCTRTKAGFTTDATPTRGYDFDNALRDGRSWEAFNPEQQAAFIEYADCRDPNLFVALGPSLRIPDRPDGEEYLPQFVEAVTSLRAGEGAAWRAK
ncbi:MAG: hypothetical protein FIA92_07660 [Chloroflexi bacterium]|nr:hypothetical protein [Chloroflexota bacterium]